jgi:hypothetical protein
MAPSSPMAKLCSVPDGTPSWLASVTVEGLASPVTGVVLAAVPKSSVID